MPNKYKVGIAGASGYTGSELLRLLIHHPNVTIQSITSERLAGQHVADVFPQLSGMVDLAFESMDKLDAASLDILFLALPHRVSMGFMKETRAHEKCTVIDLSGDFRLDSADEYEQWYGTKHEIPELIDEAVYGLTELFRDKVANARLIANPGCYPTSSILPLYPLVEAGLIHPENIIVDAKSGVTGAGAKAKDRTHFPTVNDNFLAYGLKSHRHTPEIGMALNKSGKPAANILFTPHLLPINRGILSTTYSRPVKPITDDEPLNVIKKRYDGETFIRVRNNPPEIRDVRGSNFVDVYATYDERTDTVITVSCIDNLVKGAAGQAVQNMNCRLGLNESTGLLHLPLTP